MSDEQRVLSGAGDCLSVPTLAANLLSGSHCRKGSQSNCRQTDRQTKRQTDRQTGSRHDIFFSVLTDLHADRQNHYPAEWHLPLRGLPVSPSLS